MVDDNSYRYKIALLSPELQDDDPNDVASRLSGRGVGTTAPVYAAFDDGHYAISKDRTTSKDADGKVGNLEYVMADGDTFTFRLDGKVVTIIVEESSSASISGDSIRLSPTTRLTLTNGIWHHSQPRTRYREPVSMIQTTQTCIIPSTSRIPSGSQPMLLIDLFLLQVEGWSPFHLETMKNKSIEWEIAPPKATSIRVKIHISRQIRNHLPPYIFS